MRQTPQRHQASFWRIARFILRLGTAIAKAFTYLSLEFAVYIAIGAFAIALISLGMPSKIALYLSLVLAVFSLVASFLAYRQQRIITSRTARSRSSIPATSEVKLANWIAQTLSTKAPQEWEDYQDWLHDILLTRSQLLSALPSLSDKLTSLRGYSQRKIKVIPQTDGRGLVAAILFGK